MGVLRGTEERMSVAEDPPPLHQTLPQTATPVWNESTSFLIRKPNTESLELQVLQTHPPHIYQIAVTAQAPKQAPRVQR